MTIKKKKERGGKILCIEYFKCSNVQILCKTCMSMKFITLFSIKRAGSTVHIRACNIRNVIYNFYKKALNDLQTKICLLLIF